MGRDCRFKRERRYQIEDPKNAKAIRVLVMDVVMNEEKRPHPLMECPLNIW